MYKVVHFIHTSLLLHVYCLLYTFIVVNSICIQVVNFQVNEITSNQNVCELMITSFQNYISCLNY